MKLFDFRLYIVILAKAGIQRRYPVDMAEQQKANIHLADNRNKIIVDLFGGTGGWSGPYRKAGYDVRIVTLPHLPLFEEKPGDVRDYEPPENVYGILAAPVCTMFSFARQNAKTPRDFAAGLELVDAGMAIVRKCRMAGSLKFWAMENPVGYLRQFIGKAPFRFEQWEFGDNGHKPTELWGYFNFPRKTVTEKPAAQLMKTVQTINGLNRKAVRAITPPGFARAFFAANQ